MDALRDAGVLRAIIPRRLGGLGLGTEPEGAAGLLSLLCLLGRANLSLGRLVEAHINAARLVFRFGSTALQVSMAQDAEDGHFCALWVTDPPRTGLTISAAGLLHGGKQFCSGAGHLSRAVMIATDSAEDTRLVYARLDQGVTVTPLPGGLSGMRAATTGQVAFAATPGMPFGEPGDYLREPDFSCGAWRTSAVTLGGLEGLVAQLRGQLLARGRAADPHQQARVGQALIAAETVRLWLSEAAHRAEAADAGRDAIAYVGLARLAAERACLDVIELTQRSLGVATALRSNPVERLCRDLATYLRQPAADMVLTESAEQFMAHGIPPNKEGPD